MKPLALKLALAALLAVTLAAGPQTSGFSLPWHVQAGGGSDPMTGSGWTLSGTAGQPVIGASSSAGFTAWHGYWYPTTPYQLYLPAVRRT